MILNGRRFSIALLVVAVLAAAGLVVRSRMVGASAKPYAGVIVPNLTLGDAFSPATINASKALAIAETDSTSSSFAHPYTVEYGSFAASGLALRLGGPLALCNRWGLGTCGRLP
jgi:hypothetical protein